MIRYTLIAIMLTLFSYIPASALDTNLVVRVARIQIDPARADTYKAALKDQIETAVRIEPGVLSLYAVSDKNNPARITVFEIYTNTDAYKAHLQSAHFKKYKSATKDMVQSLELIETVPIALERKEKQ